MPSCIDQAPVVGVRSFPNQNYLVAVEAPEISRRIRPGQFAMVGEELRSTSPPFPLLKRALAFYSIGFEANLQAVTFLFKVVGEGTRRLSRLRVGDRVSLLGPLGNGFNTDEAEGRLAVLVAGGIGIASFLVLAEQLLRAEGDALLVYGARSDADLVGLEDFENLGMEIRISTEDGSLGVRGRVTDVLGEVSDRISATPSILYTCGPTPMMEAVSAWSARRGIPCRLSVENRMACGFGVCLGCSVQTGQGYRLACTCGPVFEAEHFVFAQSQPYEESSKWRKPST